MSVFSKDEYVAEKHKYIIECANGNFPKLSQLETLRAYGGEFAENDFDLAVLELDIKTKHFKKKMSKYKASKMLSDLRSCEPERKSEYARTSIRAMANYVSACESWSKYRKIALILCMVFALILLVGGITGILYAHFSGLMYGEGTVTFEADGQSYSQNGVRYNNYVSLEIPAKSGYDVIGVKDSHSGKMLFDKNGVSKTKVSQRNLSDYTDCDLEVVYEPHVYDATIYAVSASSPLAFEFTIEDNPEDILEEPQHLDGYVFDGWFTDAAYKKPFSGDFKDYIDEPLVLYPHYSLDGWTITWDLQGGEMIGSRLDNYTILTDVALPKGDEVKRRGYNFAGWAVNGKIVEYFPATNMQDVTLVAVWKPQVYKLTYQANGGELEYTEEEFTIEESLILQTPVRPAYAFEGWYFDKSYKTKVTEIEIGTVGDMTVYAKWVPIEYHIQYDLGGGENSALNPTTYTVEHDVKLMDPSRRGYNFCGWRDVHTGEDKTNLSAVEDENIVLVATWELQTYKVLYQPNGGEIECLEQEFTIESSLVLQTPVRPAYAFEGWYIDKSYKIKVIEIEIGTVGDITVYAKWSPIIYHIEYNLDGGENSQFNPTTYTIEHDVTLADAYRRGYQFVGWCNECTGENKLGLSAVTDGDIILVAMWEPEIYKVIYHSDCGEVKYTKQEFTIESSLVLQTPVRPAYAFEGWYLDKSYKTKVTEIEIGTVGDITVYAKWAPIEYHIQYDLGGGENSALNPTIYTIEHDVKLMDPSRRGYNFCGWRDVHTGEDKTNLSAVEDENIVLVATWIAKEYTITVCPDNGQPISKQTVTFDSYYCITTPIIKGYVMKGLSLAGEDFAAVGIYTYDMDVMIVAHYEARQYQISYVSEGSTIQTQTVTFDQPYVLYIPSVRANYEFIGWLDKSVNGSKISDGVFKYDTNIVLYAAWIKVLTINLESGKDYTVDKTIEKVYVVGNYFGPSDNLMTDICITVSTRDTDLTMNLVHAGFKGKENRTAIDCMNSSYTLKILLSGNSFIEGGKGSDGEDGKSGSTMNESNRNGAHGQDGGHALNCGTVIFEQVVKNSTLTLKGGDGGHGGNGGIDKDRSRMWLNYVPDGGFGGDSGAALSCINYSVNGTTVNFAKGLAGAAGKAGSRGDWWCSACYGKDGTSGKQQDVIILK